MNEEHLRFDFEARYFKSSAITNETKSVWFVLHGYGQLAPYFIRKFQVLEQFGICVIAPEGLSRFYLHMFEPGGSRKNDRVGATWMTKENRLMDIRNYLNYLNTIAKKEITKPVDVKILGFSQGAATATRWAADCAIHFHDLILWAGMLPDDMDIEQGNALKEKRISMVYGTEDPFLTDTRFDKMRELTDRLGVIVKPITFAGGHDITPEALLQLHQSIAANQG